MRKRALAIGLAAIMLVFVFGLSACSASHDIPLGKYVSTDGTEENSTLLRDGVADYDYFWDIENNKATWYSSGSKNYVGKIVKKNGELYFYGETWFELISLSKNGRTTVYKVEYDDATKNLTVIAE